MIINKVNKSIHLDYLIWDKISSEQLRNSEVSLCKRFGWENCKSSIILPRGGTNNYYLNDSLYTGTIFKKFKFVHREKLDKIRDLRIYDTQELGRVLVLDGYIQFDNDPKNVYVDLMIKNIVNDDKQYENILILGANDTVILKELATKKNIGKIVLVENDEKILNVVKKFLNLEEILNNNKFEIIREDYKYYLKNNQKKFDGILIPFCEHSKLIVNNVFDQEFYKSVSLSLNKDASFSQKVEDHSLVEIYEKHLKDNNFNIKNFSCEVPDHNTKVTIIIGLKN